MTSTKIDRPSASAVANSQNRLAVYIVAVLFLVLASRALGNEILRAWGLAPIPLFFDPSDRFADLLKSGLSYKFIASSVVGTANFASWPPLFQNYLLHNPYNDPSLTNLMEMPLAALMLMTAAKLAVLVGPGLSFLAFFTVYTVGACAIGMLLRSLSSNRNGFGLAVYACLFSYPALYMLNRGNFHSGMTSLCLIVYALSVAYRKHRWLGLACLSVAVNLRPNTAVFATIEILCGRSLRERCSGPLIGGLLSLGTWFILLQIVHSIYPEYSLPSFLHGYRNYDNLYSVGDWGLQWNSSLFGAIKSIRTILDIQPHYSETLYYLVCAIGIVVYIAILATSVRASARPSGALFLISAFCTLFTPIFGLYHILEFAAPLLVVWSSRSGWDEMSAQDRLTLVVSLIMLCPLAGPLTNGLLEVAILIGALGVMLSQMWTIGRKDGTQTVGTG